MGCVHISFCYLHSLNSSYRFNANSSVFDEVKLFANKIVKFNKLGVKIRHFWWSLWWSLNYHVFQIFFHFLKKITSSHHVRSPTPKIFHFSPSFAYRPPKICEKNFSKNMRFWRPVARGGGLKSKNFCCGGPPSMRGSDLFKKA